MKFKDVRELDQNKKVEWSIMAQGGDKGIAVEKKTSRGTWGLRASTSKRGGKKVEFGFKIPLK